LVELLSRKINKLIKYLKQKQSCVSKNLDAFRRIIPGIGEELRDELCTLLIEHKYSFSFETSDLGHTELVKHTIDTQGQGPIHQQAYRFSPHQRETAQEIIDELLRFKIIQPSLSPWAAPIVLVKKKTGDVRLCVDYRKLNAITKKGFVPSSPDRRCLGYVRRSKILLHDRSRVGILANRDG
jgi:hypothetical protein